MIGSYRGYGIRAHVEDRRRRHMYGRLKVRCPDSSRSAGNGDDKDMKEVKRAILMDGYDLLERLLDPNYLKRITAREALSHRFFSHYTFENWACPDK